MINKSINRGFAILMIALIVFVLALSIGSAKNDKVRVISNSEIDNQKAIDNGCVNVQSVKKLKAFECDSKVALGLGMKEDIKLYATDVNANTQVGANSISNSQKLNVSGKGRKIAVLDTGYNYNHPDLAKSYLGGRDFVNFDNDAMDDNGHGSHVAGLITSDGILNANAKGIASDTGIISGKVLNADGYGYFSDVIAGIYWAVDNYHPDAISVSLGSNAPYIYTGFCDDLYPDFTNAVKYAIDNNVSFVAAAGNNGASGVSFPGCISNSFTVGAVDSYDNVASFSGNGKAVDVAAPGVNLVSTWLNSDYEMLSGTSMSTPIVAGVIALMKEKNSKANPGMIEKTILRTADVLKSGKLRMAFGRINAFNSVKFL